MGETNKVKIKKQQTWASGDYSVFSAKLVIVSELLCESVDLRANHNVLDVATGNGNTALSAARRGCTVTGIDFTQPLLEQARQRATAEHLKASFQEGDVEAIPFPDQTFDIVLSTFGVMFSPDHQKTADELWRVCRPAGKIGLANWSSTGANLAEDEVMGKHFPSPHESPPNPWTSEAGLQGLFLDRAASLQVNIRSAVYRFASIKAYVDGVFTMFGPVMKMIQGFTEGQRASLKDDLVAALSPFNQSSDETLVLPFDYIEAVITKPG